MEQLIARPKGNAKKSRDKVGKERGDTKEKHKKNSCRKFLGKSMHKRALSGHPAHPASWFGR